MRAPDPTGLVGAIHSIAIDDPPDPAAFNVDFGSAPTDAFIELLRTLAAIGAERIEVWSALDGRP
jgi:hypothetical protein